MKKNTRIKIKLEPITTRAEAEAVMNNLAFASVAKIKEQARMDHSILQIKERHAEELANFDSALKAKTELLRAWAEANPAEFPKGLKSIQFASGRLGFRTGTPALALLNKKWNWEKVCEAVAGLLPNFIRNKPEVDKAALLAQSDEPIIAQTLPQVGLKVTQGESFFVEPDLTRVETKHSEAA